jgi:hypothetical protein
MTNFTYAVVISVIYTVLRFIETKYILKSQITLKTIVKDAFYSYLAAISGIYIVNNIISNEVVSGDKIKVFTGEPDF